MQIREISMEEWRQLTADGLELAVRIPLNGASMMPLIRRQRDRVTIVPVKRPLRRGDVVLFQRADGAYVVHRIIKLSGELVQTLGDNCTAPDSPVFAEAVLGLVTHVQRGRRSFHVDTAFWRSAGCVWSAGLPLRNFFCTCLRAIKRLGKALLRRNRT